MSIQPDESTFSPKDFTADAYRALASEDPVMTALSAANSRANTLTWPRLDIRYIEQVEVWLAQVSYKPGWNIELRTESFAMTGYLNIAIRATVADSYHPEKEVEIGSVVVLPAHFVTLADFAHWLATVLRDREIHESREWFKVNGRPFDNPHTIDGWKSGS